jgi:hypothetical protein
VPRKQPFWYPDETAALLEPFGMLALFGLLTALPAILVMRTLDPELVLPAFSVLLFAEAAIAGIVARLIRVPRTAANVTAWDFAGALTLIGCAAAMFGEPDQAALFLEGQGVQRSDSRPS